MAKTILIELEAKDKASAKVKKVEKSVESLGQKTSKSMKGASNSLEDVQVKLNRMGNKLRFMTIAFSVLAGGAIALTKGFVNSAKEMEAATLRVGVFAVSSGQSMEKAQEAALNLARTGLVSVTEASNTLSNLLATGLNIDTAEKLMKKMLDTAVLSKESLTDTFGKALEKSSLGIRILQERQVDAIGINFRADQVWRAYGKTIGKTSAEMTTQEKQMAIVNFLMQETERFAGGADLAMQTFGGSMSRLSTNIEIMKAKLGATLIPLIGSLSDILSVASRKLSDFAEKWPALTSIMLSGSTILITVVASLAALGAVIPLVSGGVGGLTTVMVTLGSVGALVAIKFLAVAAVLGGLIFLTLKLTGLWDKWANSAKNLAQRIKDTINPFKKQGEAASDASEKLRKSIEKIERQMFLTTRSFKENLAEWVDKNKKAVEDITTQITELRKKYKEAVDGINNDFSGSMKDATLAHSRKTEDLQRDIDEEVSKGIWADQTRIRSLKLSLKRENEDFARHTSKLKSDKTSALKKEDEVLNERLLKLQAELDKELAMQKKHSKEIADVQNVVILDVIEKMTRAHDERLKDLKEQLTETKKSTTGQEDAFANMLVNTQEGFGNLAESIDKPISKVEKLRQEFEKAQQRAATLSTVGGRTGDILKNAGRNAFNAWKRVGETIWDAIESSNIYRDGVGKIDQFIFDIPKNVGGFFSNLYKGIFKADGGPVSGGKPYIVGEQGPEMFVPSSAGNIIPNNSQTSMIININNPTVRNDNDIQRIATAVQEVLSRKQQLRHFT